MLVLKNPKIAVPVVLFAGLIWSFGPLVVRYMDSPHLIPWQYIFGRGLTIFILLNLYLFFEEGKDFYKNYFKIGTSGLVGGSGLGVAMISFMFSITNTSAAITLLCLAAMPFFTALLAFLFLREKNFFKCLGINNYCICWNRYNGNRKYFRDFTYWICFWYYFICRFFSIFSIIKMA